MAREARFACKSPARPSLRTLRVDGDARYRDALQEYADVVWDRLRDQSTGLFHFDGSGSAKLLEQAAMVQI